MTEIDEVINGLDKNIQFLESPYRLENKDIKGLLIDVIGTMRDLWQKFADVFKMMDEINEINKAIKNEKLHEEIPLKDQDLKNLYL